MNAETEIDIDALTDEQLDRLNAALTARRYGRYHEAQQAALDAHSRLLKAVDEYTEAVNHVSRLGSQP